MHGADLEAVRPLLPSFLSYALSVVYLILASAIIAVEGRDSKLAAAM